MNDTAFPRDVVRHDFPTDWTPFLREVLAAYVARLDPTAKHPHTPSALVPLAFCALALSLSVVVSPDRWKAAHDRAAPPGRKPAAGRQTTIFDFCDVPAEGAPFVSLVRLKSGTVLVSHQQYTLDLHGVRVPSTAAARAVVAGWSVRPDVYEGAVGLRFEPPTPAGLTLARLMGPALSALDNCAMAARPPDVNPNDGPTIIPEEEAELRDALLTQADADQPRHLDIAPPGTHNPDNFGPDSFGGSDLPHAPAVSQDITIQYYDDGGAPECFAMRSAAPTPDLTIGDAVRFASGRYAGRMATLIEIGGDKPKARLVGRAVELSGAIDVPGDAVDVTGSDPDDASLRPSALTKRKKKKPSDKRKPSGIEGKARAKDGKRRAT